jgi:hypothetical protein
MWLFGYQEHLRERDSLRCFYKARSSKSNLSKTNSKLKHPEGRKVSFNKSKFEDVACTLTPGCGTASS